MIVSVQMTDTWNFQNIFSFKGNTYAALVSWHNHFNQFLQIEVKLYFCNKNALDEGYQINEVKL